VFVVLLVADVDADVVQQGGIFEPFTLAIGQAVNRTRLLEEHQREARDLLRVLGPVMTALGELEHASPPKIRVAIGLRDQIGRAHV